MRLSKENLSAIKSLGTIETPDERLLNLPEKVLQFGTGVLLRGLPDYYIDKANRSAIFNGRVVVVKSTAQGATDAFAEQDGLYTHCIRGVEESSKISESVINSAISRVLSATGDWQEILKCAHNPEMQVIISNTTEVGIVLSNDRISDQPPASFPGKLLAFLVERYKTFKGTAESGMVIVPTELITDNGTKLREIIFTLAKQNELDASFMYWLGNYNYFCNSLVDRIVPGRLSGAEQQVIESGLGYKDELMIMSESFSLWAIESASDIVKERLSFSRADKGVVIAGNIEKFRELKLRLLNGTHTFACGLAFLAGFETVKDAMNDTTMAGFVRRLTMLEIAQALDGAIISYNEAGAFANSVMDRFRNPFIDHKWISITMNFSSKMKMRNVPLLLRHYQKTSKVPAHMALGFAAFLLFMRCDKNETGEYFGELNGRTYAVQDDKAEYFSAKWNATGREALVAEVLADEELWGANLAALPGFGAAVTTNLRNLEEEGAMTAIEQAAQNKTTV